MVPSSYVSHAARDTRSVRLSSAPTHKHKYDMTLLSIYTPTYMSHDSPQHLHTSRLYSAPTHAQAHAHIHTSYDPPQHTHINTHHMTLLSTYTRTRARTHARTHTHTHTSYDSPQHIHINTHHMTLLSTYTPTYMSHDSPQHL